MQSIYGLPNKTINIENVAAEKAGMVGITNAQFQTNQRKAEAGISTAGDGDANSFLADTRIQDILNKGTVATAAKPIVELRPMNPDEIDDPEIKAEVKQHQTYTFNNQQNFKINQ